MSKEDEKKDELYEDNWPLFEKFLGYLRYLKIKKYIQEMDKPVCADIGCGFNGRFLFSIADKIGYGYGFDLRANNRKSGNIEIINNQALDGRLPLEEGTVDRVFLLAVLEHLDETAVIIDESFRVLKSGGKIIITTPTTVAKPVLEFLSYRLHLISEESIREHKHYYTKNELQNLLRQHDCECEVYKTFQVCFNQLLVGKKK